MKVPFVKMHGNGNDFVIVDNTKLKLKYNKSFIKKLSSRRLGIGCDQFIILKKSKKYDIFMKIYNPNGEEAEMCGDKIALYAEFGDWIDMEEEDELDIISLEPNT